MKEWLKTMVAPIVTVIKEDGSARICRGYKMTVHQLSWLGSYPVPNIETLTAEISGGKNLQN